MNVCDSVEFKNDIDQFFEQSNNLLHVFFIVEVNVERLDTAASRECIICVVCLLLLLVEFVASFDLFDDEFPQFYQSSKKFAALDLIIVIAQKATLVLKS